MGLLPFPVAYPSKVGEAVLPPPTPLYKTIL